jgi:hypothetical protein
VPAGRFSLRLPVAFGAMRAALQWRLLVLWAVLLLVPTLLAVAPAWGTLARAFDHSVHAAELARRLDLVALKDLIILFKTADPSRNMPLAVLVTALLSPLLAGMVACAARADAPLRLRELVAGGIAQYPRMLGMLVWALVPLGVALGIGSGLSQAAKHHADHALLAADADFAQHLALLGNVLLFALAQLSVDAGRAMLALDRRRANPVGAWWDGVKLMWRRPVATIGSMLVIAICAAVVVGGLGVLRIALDGPGTGLFVLGIVLTQLGSLTLGWMRCARLFALVELGRA